MRGGRRTAAAGCTLRALRRLTGADAEQYRAVRLDALRDHPESFGSSHEDEADKPLAWFADRLESGFVLGGFGPDGSLLGTAGLVIPAGSKLRHKGLLIGMFVRPASRGTGLAQALLDGVLVFARPLVEEVNLGVTGTNTAAIRLYARSGFVEYAREARVLKVGDRYYDEVFMARRP